MMRGLTATAAMMVFGCGEPEIVEATCELPPSQPCRVDVDYGADGVVDGSEFYEWDSDGRVVSQRVMKNSIATYTFTYAYTGDRWRMEYRAHAEPRVMVWDQWKVDDIWTLRTSDTRDDVQVETRTKTDDLDRALWHTVDVGVDLVIEERESTSWEGSAEEGWQLGIVDVGDDGVPDQRIEATFTATGKPQESTTTSMDGLQLAQYLREYNADGLLRLFVVDTDRQSEVTTYEYTADHCPTITTRHDLHTDELTHRVEIVYSDGRIASERTDYPGLSALRTYVYDCE